MKIIPLAILGALTLLSSAQQTQNIQQEVEDILEETQEQIQQRLRKEQFHEQFQQLEQKLKLFLEEWPETLNLPIKKIKEVVLNYFLEKDPDGQEHKQKASEFLQHIMNEHQDEFGITNINTNMDEEEEIEENP